MPNSLQCWLSYNNGAERLQLPVNPNSIKITTGHGYQDVNVMNLGEITIIGDSVLKEFSFSSFFPRDYNPAYCEYVDIPDPWDAVRMIERWMSTRRPIRFTVTGTPINYAVTVRSFDYEERGGSPGDIYYSIMLKEYKFLTFRQITVTTESTAVVEPPQRPSTKEVPSYYVVQSGDTLWAIAQRIWGDGSRWREIYNLNADVIGPDPNSLKVGTRLVVPGAVSERQVAQAKTTPPVIRRPSEATSNRYYGRTPVE